MAGLGIYGELLGAQLENLASDANFVVAGANPTGIAPPGLIYFSSATKLPRWHTGAAWVSGVDDVTAQDISNKTFISGTTFLKNATGTNRKIGFDLGAATDSTTATLTFIQSANAAYTFPQTSATLAGLTSTQTFTNKTFSDEVQVRNLYATGTSGLGTLELKAQDTQPSLRGDGGYKLYIDSAGRLTKLQPSGSPLHVEPRSVMSQVTAVAASGTVLQNTAYLVQTTAARTLTLYQGASGGALSTIIIKDSTGGANIYNITVLPFSGTIDGAASYIMNTPYESATFMFDGTNWFTL